MQEINFLEGKEVLKHENSGVNCKKK